MKDFKKGSEVLIFVFLKDYYNRDNFMYGRTVVRKRCGSGNRKGRKLGCEEIVYWGFYICALF